MSPLPLFHPTPLPTPRHIPSLSHTLLVLKSLISLHSLNFKLKKDMNFFKSVFSDDPDSPFSPPRSANPAETYEHTAQMMEGQTQISQVQSKETLKLGGASED